MYVLNRFEGREAVADERLAVSRIRRKRGSGWIDPDGRRQSWRRGCAMNKAGRMQCISCAERSLPLCENRRSLSEMDGGRREQSQLAMMVLVVVPGEEGFGPRMGMVLGIKTLWIVRMILHGLELCPPRRDYHRVYRAANGFAQRLNRQGTAPMSWRSSPHRDLHAKPLGHV